MEARSQEERLQQEILTEARNRADKIVARANSAAATAKARAEKDAQALRERTLEQTRKEAAVKARNIIQGIWMEERKMWLRKREECLTEFFQSLLKDAQELRADDQSRVKSLEKLAKEALEALEASEMVVSVSEKDLTLVTPQWIAAQAGREVQATVTADKAILGGIRIATPDGLRVYDNTYAGRMARLQENFRRELAGCDVQKH